MQPSYSSNSSIYDSNPWRNLSDSAFASSQSSLGTGSAPRDCLSRSSEEFFKSNQSPVQSIYRTYMYKEQPFSRPSSSLSRQSSISNLPTEGIKSKAEMEKIAQLVFVVKDLSEKFTKLSENVDYTLTKLVESVDQKLEKSNVETQRYIKTLFKNLAHEVQVSASERARIAELENIIKEKNYQIGNLESELENFQRHGIENAMSSLKTTISTELQTRLTLVHQMTIQMVKQNSSSNLELECKMERLLTSIKEIVVNEIDSNMKKHLPESQKNRLVVERSINQKPSNAAPVKTPSTRPPFDNIFEIREEFERCISNSSRLTPVSRGTPVKLLPKATQRSSRTSIKMATPKQPKSIRRIRQPRSLISNRNKSKPVIWSYRGQCSSIQPSELSFASENCDSISEGSSPSYSISLMALHKESPNVAIIDHFKSGLTF